jgi:hypothetical protein
MNLNRDDLNLKVLISIFAIVAFILVIISQFFYWGSLDAEVKIGGDLIASAEASLEADFNEYKVSYAVNTERGEESNTIKDEKVFLSGMGDFQENVGEILDSFKDKKYTIRSSKYNNEGEREYTNVTVTTHSELVPWWPDGMDQKCEIIVTIDTFGSSTEKVIIDRVWLELWSDWDDDLDDYTKKETVWEKKSYTELKSAGSEKSYSAEISVDTDNQRYGLVGRVNMTIIDDEGNQIRQILPFASTSHPTTINIYSMGQDQFISIVLMVVAYPLSLISIVFGLIAIMFLFFKKRIGRYLLLTAAILGLLGFIFYLNGLNTLVDLLDSALVTDIKSGYELDWSIMSLPIVSAILLFIGFGLTFLMGREIAVPKAAGVAVKKGPDKAGKQPTIVFKAIETEPEPDELETDYGEEEIEGERKTDAQKTKKRGRVKRGKRVKKE